MNFRILFLRYIVAGVLGFAYCSAISQLSPKADVEKCEAFLSQKKSIHLVVVATGEDPSNSELWIDRPGHLGSRITWQPTQSREKTIWHLELNGNRLTALDPSRNLYFQNFASTPEQKRNLYNKFLGSVSAPIAVLISPLALDQFLSPFKNKSALWHRRLTANEIQWSFANKGVSFSLSFSKGTGMIDEIRVRSSSLKANYRWLITLKPWSPVPHVSVPDTAMFSGFSLAQTTPLYANLTARCLAKSCLTAYSNLGRAKVLITEGNTHTTVWKLGRFVWELIEDKGLPTKLFYWDGTKATVYDGRKYHEKKLILTRLPGYLETFRISLDALARSFLSGNNFAARIFQMNSKAVAQGKMDLGGKSLSLVRVIYPSIALNVQVNSETFLIEELSREDVKLGVESTQPVSYQYLRWSVPPKLALK